MSYVSRLVNLLDCWHWLLLILAAPLLLFPSPARSIAFLIIPTIWIIGVMAHSEPIPHTPLNLSMLLLSFTVLVSLYATYDIEVSLPRLSGIILAIGVFFAIVREGQHFKGWWLSLIAFLGVGLGFAALGLLGTSWIAKIGFLTPIISRLPAQLTQLSSSGQGFHPNQVAGALLWILPILIAGSILLGSNLKAVKNIYRPNIGLLAVSLFGIISVFIGGVFILTQSRNGYFALFFSSIIIAIIYFSLYKQKLFWIGIIVLIIGGGLIFVQQDLGENLYDFEVTQNRAFSLDSLAGRIELWSRAQYAISDFPFTGMGMNTFRYVVHVMYPPFLISPDFDVGHAHNEYLQVALDLGLPGLIAYLALHGGAFWMLIETWKYLQIEKNRADLAFQTDDPPSPESAFQRQMFQVIILGFGGGLLAHMMYGFLDAVVLGARQGILFWILLGLITSLFLQIKTDHLPRLA